MKENRHEQVILDNAQIRANLLVEDSTLTKTFLAQAVDVGGNIDLKRTVFEGPVNLIGAKTAGILFAKDSQFKGKFNASNLDAAGGIFLINITYSTTVYLIGAKTAGILFAKDSQFKGEFDAMNFAGSDMILSNVSFDKRVGLLDMKLSKQLEIKDSVFKDEFDAENIEASARIVLTNTIFKEAVNLTEAKTAGTLFADDSQFKGQFMAFNLDAAGGIILTNTTFKERAALDSAKTAGMLSARNSQFEKEFIVRNLDAASHIILTNTTFKQTVDLSNAKTAGRLSAKNSQFEEKFIANYLAAGIGIIFTETHFEGQVDLRFAELGGMLKLTGSSFASTLNLSQTHIANGFVLYENEGKMKPSVPLWKEGAKLMLNDAHAGVLHASTKSWLIYDGDNRSTTELLARELHGFTYDSLHLTEGSDIDDEGITRLIEWAGGATAVTMKTDRSTKKETLWRNMIDYLDLGGKQCVALEWQKGKTNYTPQPYTELAEKLREMGAADQADRVLIARDNHYYETQYPSELDKFDKAMGEFSCYVSRYGVEPFRPLYLFLFLIFLGVLINLIFAYKSFYKESERSWIAWIAWVPLNFLRILPHSLIHSIRNSIPIPGLLSDTKETKHNNCIYLYLIYIQKILSLFLLASALGYLAI